MVGPHMRYLQLSRHRHNAGVGLLLWGFLTTNNLLQNRASSLEDTDFDDALAELGKLQANFENKKRKVAENMPFFSLNLPLQEEEKIVFKFFEPRYVMMANQIEQGNRIYGYTDAYPPRPGGVGTLIDTHDEGESASYRWLGPRPNGPVVVTGKIGPRFKILEVKTQEAPEKQGAPLYLGKVALITEDDLGEEAKNANTEETKQHSREQLISHLLLSMGIVVEEDDIAPGKTLEDAAAAMEL